MAYYGFSPEEIELARETGESFERLQDDTPENVIGSLTSSMHRAMRQGRRQARGQRNAVPARRETIEDQKFRQALTRLVQAGRSVWPVIRQHVDASEPATRRSAVARKWLNYARRLQIQKTTGMKATGRRIRRRR